MPIETFAFIDSLVATNPTHTDALSDADSHLRGIKQTLKSTFPNVNGAVAATDEELSAAGTAFAHVGTVEIAANGTVAGGELRLDGVTAGTDILMVNTGTAAGPARLSITMTQGTTTTAPLTLAANGDLAVGSVNAASIMKTGHELLPTGVICMWSGSLATVPSGWSLCDGTSGTPDLRNRFILGAGGTGYSGPGTTGGAFSATATTSSAGSHSHGGATFAGGGISIAPGTTSDGQHGHGLSTAGYALTVNDIPPHQHQVPGMIFGSQTAGQSYLGLGSDSSLSGVAGAGSVQNTSVSSQVGAGFAHVHGIILDGTHNHTVPITLPDHSHSIALDGGHTHSVSMNTTPPYYALAFIMKL